MARYVNIILAYFGYRLIKSETYRLYIESNYIDLRNSILKFTPFDLQQFQSKKPINYVLNISSRSLMDNPIFHVWIKTLHSYAGENKSQKVQERNSYKIMVDYFQSYQPENVGAILGINTLEIKNDYFEKDALAAVYPWLIKPTEFYFQQRQEIMRQEFKENGVNNYNYKKDGYKFFGPVSEQLVLVEYQRLTQLYDSIKEKGFVDDYGFPSVNCFINGSQYLLEVKDRFHSVGAMLALGFTEIPLIFSHNFGTINREKAKDWKHVKTELFSEAVAVKLFDKVFKPINL